MVWQCHPEPIGGFEAILGCGRGVGPQLGSREGKPLEDVLRQHKRIELVGAPIAGRDLLDLGPGCRAMSSTRIGLEGSKPGRQNGRYPPASTVIGRPRFCSGTTWGPGGNGPLQISPTSPLPNPATSNWAATASGGTSLLCSTLRAESSASVVTGGEVDDVGLVELAAGSSEVLVADLPRKQRSQPDDRKRRPPCPG